MVGWQIYHLPKYKPVTAVPNTVVNFSGQNPTVPVTIAPGGGFVRGHLVGFFGGQFAGFFGGQLDEFFQALSKGPLLLPA